MKYLMLFVLVSFCFFSCGNGTGRLVLISTDFGDMVVKLYDETPQHRNNFIRLVQQGFHDDLLIHAVSRYHSISGGAPESRNAPTSRAIGMNNEIGRTIPAEIAYPQRFHKRGALGAVRADASSIANLDSSGSMFYIVLGTVFTHEELDEIEETENDRRLNRILEPLFLRNRDSLSLLIQHNMTEELEIFKDNLIARARTAFDERGAFQFTAEQRKAFTTIGGIPHMDGEYTIFGEIIEGLDILDRIAEVQTGINNRPTQDIRVRMKVIR